MLAEKYKKPFFCWADINILIIDDLSTLNSKDLYPNILIYWTVDNDANQEICKLLDINPFGFDNLLVQG